MGPKPKSMLIKNIYAYLLVSAAFSASAFGADTATCKITRAETAPFSHFVGGTISIDLKTGNNRLQAIDENGNTTITAAYLCSGEYRDRAVVSKTILERPDMGPWFGHFHPIELQPGQCKLIEILFDDPFPIRPWPRQLELRLTGLGPQVHQIDRCYEDPYRPPH